MAKTETLNIDLLVIDADTQARVSIHADTVDEYAELITNNKDWPFDLLDVFHDGNNYLVADGFHRTLAAQRLDVKSVPCRVHKGTAKDARIFGMTANDQHGLRMSRADKRHCVEWLLDNGGKLTQLEMSIAAGVGKRTVQSIVASRKPEKAQVAPFGFKNTGETSNPPSKPTEAPASEEIDDDEDEIEEDEDEIEESDPWGEPEAELDPQLLKPADWRTARSKAKKTVEALMRALCDLNGAKSVPLLDSHLDDCRAIILELDAMK
jgi:ParB-like chromosome segregation protein Spo0J